MLNLPSSLELPHFSAISPRV